MKRRILTALTIFVAYEAAVWLLCIGFLAPSTALLVGFVLTVCGVTLLGVYALVSRLAPRQREAAPAGSAPQEAATPPAPAKSAVPDEDAQAVAALIAEANRQLEKSPTLASERTRNSIADFPAYLLFGPEGSGKTSLFLSSGLDPELLAGQVQRDTQVVPTRVGNVWFAARSVVIEAAGRYFSAEPEHLTSFLEAFRGGASNSKLGRFFGPERRLDLRAVIVCCDASTWVGLPDTAHQNAISRRVQSHLRAVAQILGADFPVYIVFTKSDSIPYFAEFFANLPGDEDSQVFGCVLPPQDAASRNGSADSHAEAEGKRISNALTRLYISLAEKRLTLLERERDRARKPAIYEFPREFKRVRGPLVQFLVEAFRPNPLQPGPLLRGIYFTGTRTVAATASGPAQSLERTATYKVGEATRLFTPEELRSMRAERPEPRGGGEKLITKWAFAPELFRGIVRTNARGPAPTRIDRRKQARRRAAFAAVTAVAALACVFFVTSWYRNHVMLRDLRAAAERCEPRAANASPSPANLQAFDDLRAGVQRLTDYEITHPPLFMRFGLYSGSAVLDSARRVYFARFREYFLDGIVRRLEAVLSTLPNQESPSYPYEPVYTSLKAYRTMTSSSSEGSCTPDKSFADWLLASWREGRAVDAESERIARASFGFYASELSRGKARPALSFESKDEPVVAHARQYLASFRGVEPEYHRIIEQVSEEMSTARLADVARSTKYRSVLRVADEVPGPYTRAGWDRVQQLIDSASRGRASDSCVLGTGGARIAAAPGADLKQQLRELYLRDYIKRWTDFLSNAAVLPYNGCGDAARKLEVFKDNNSPILAVLLFASENTTFQKASQQASQAGGAASGTADRRLVDRLSFGRKTGAAPQSVQAATQTTGAGPGYDTITATFQPAHAVFESSPPNRERWVDKGNEPYLNALGDLQRALQNLDRGGKCDDSDQAANNQASSDMTKALAAVDGLARRFNSAGAYDPVKALLEAPIRGARALINTDPTEGSKRKLNGGAQQLCTALGSLKHKYPFSPQGDDATLEQVGAVFAPQSSLLASMRDVLGDQLIRAGRLWVQKPDAPVKLSKPFLDFYNRMWMISDALFAPQETRPGMHYRLVVRPNPGVKRILGTIDGEPFSGQDRQYGWPSQKAGIDLRVEQAAGGSTPLRSYSGPWGIFQLLSGADQHVPGSNTFGLVNVQGGKRSIPQPILPDGSPVVFEVIEFPNGVQRAFDSDFFRVTCPPRATE